MARFQRENAAALARDERGDASVTQAEVAGMTGMSQSILAQIEYGRRALSSDLRERIPRAADYRPSAPLAHHAASISRYAAERGLGDLRVFGSLARGTGGLDSDIDLVGTPTRELPLFELADIASYSTELTGFPTGVHADTLAPEFLREPTDEAVPLWEGPMPLLLGRASRGGARPSSTPITSCASRGSSPTGSSGWPRFPPRRFVRTARSMTPRAW